MLASDRGTPQLGLLQRMLAQLCSAPTSAFVSQDFQEMMPLPMYTLPNGAPLNWATMMLKSSNPTDLGPKTYVALGTEMVSRVATAGVV